MMAFLSIAQLTIAHQELNLIYTEYDPIPRASDSSSEIVIKALGTDC